MAVRNLFYSKDEIASCQVGDLFSFFLEQDCVTVCHAFFNSDLQHLCLSHNSVTSAFEAVSSSGVALASTFRTLDLHLHSHEPHVLNLHNDSLPVALSALPQLPIFGS